MGSRAPAIHEVGPEYVEVLRIFQLRHSSPLLTIQSTGTTGDSKVFVVALQQFVEIAEGY